MESSYNETAFRLSLRVLLGQALYEAVMYLNLFMTSSGKRGRHEGLVTC